MPLKFAFKNGKYYHTECYANAKATAPKCFKCEGPIIGSEVSVVLGNDMKFHARCFVCDGCGQQLSDRFYQNNSLFYHQECVICSLCNSNLNGLNFSQLQDGGYVCDPCLYQQMRQEEKITAVNGQHDSNPDPVPLQQQYYGQPAMAQPRQQPFVQAQDQYANAAYFQQQQPQYVQQNQYGYQVPQNYVPQQGVPQRAPTAQSALLNSHNNYGSQGSLAHQAQIVNGGQYYQQQQQQVYQQQQQQFRNQYAR
ncbi:hypothetical protein MIR68_005718 [Amoeboaphelidium protococcarum]|nr:hypothetical protein MIR68_005718 [Amoeboaphelidium protococcarum]